MKTRELPAPEQYQDRFEDKEQQRVQKNNAFKFTAAINADLRRAKNPTIVAVGWDGCTCNTKLIQEWLPSVPEFQWIVRIPNLKYNANPDYLENREGAWWTSFGSASLASSLSDVQRSPNLTQVIRIWEQIQNSKDLRPNEHALHTGRNAVDLNEIVSEVETKDKAEST